MAKGKQRRRIGIFGGTFDPPHRVHIEIALAAIESLELDFLEMIPTSRPPHRPPSETSSWHRHAMCVLAALDHPEILVSTRELERGGTSYTVDTLAQVQQENPQAELFLVVGGDSHRDLTGWKDWREIVRIARLAVISRPGADVEKTQCASSDFPSVIRIPMKPSALSASDIRKALADGAPVGDALDARVLAYLSRHGLYRTGDRKRIGHNPTEPPEHR